MSELERVSWPGWDTVRFLGRGNYGSVYEIQRDVFGDIERAALKVITIPQNEGDIDELYSEGYDDESISSAFESHLKSIVAEYSLMKKMSGCSNIVNCDDVRYIQHDDGIGWDIYIKMELLTALPKALPSGYDEGMILAVAKDICSALERCKKHEIIHRDIKPQNIFVSPSGDYKLGDFGIAKTVEKTMGGTKIGTYKYMAPEVYHYQPYGSGADIYSLGLVLYWLMNERRLPFMPLPPEKPKAGMEEEARHRRLSGEPLPPPANGSKKLKEIVLKACAYDPKDRYQSAAEMKDALMQLFADDRKPVEITAKDNTPVVIVADRPKDTNSAAVSSEVSVSPAKKKATVPAPEVAELKKIEPVTFSPAEVWQEEEAAYHAWLDSQQPRQKDQDDAVAAETPAKEKKKEKNRPKPEKQKKEKKQRPDTPKKGWRKSLVVLGLCVIAAVAMLIALKPKDIVACDHVWLKATCAAPKTCSVCGMISGVPLAHSWSKATCTSPRICSVCGKISGESLGHSWSEATCTAPRMCSRCGIISGVSLGHSWSEATCTRPKRCSVCKVTTGSALGHIWLEATETAPKTCQRCGSTEGDVRFQAVDIAVGLAHTLVLKSDGTVKATGANSNGQCNVSAWTDIVAVFAGDVSSAGIKSDGTVVVTGRNDYGQCDVADWTDIVSVAMSQFHTVGLKSDGTVVAVGDTSYGGCDVSSWRNIVSICVTQTGTIGVKADGSIVATRRSGLDWSGISTIAYDGSSHLAVGLRSDGSIVIGEPGSGESSLYPEIYSEFKNIVAVAVCRENVYGLTADGQVIAAHRGIVWIKEWTDVCKIAGCGSNLVGLKKDGTLVE